MNDIHIKNPEVIDLRPMTFEEKAFFIFQIFSMFLTIIAIIALIFLYIVAFSI